MGIRLKFRNSVTMSSTVAEEEDIAAIKPTSYEVSDASTEGSTRTFKVASGSVDSAVDLAGLEVVSFISLRTDRPITLNATTPDGEAEIQVKVLTGFEYGYFIATTNLTALSITNSSGGTARILMSISGDED